MVANQVVFASILLLFVVAGVSAGDNENDAGDLDQAVQDTPTADASNTQLSWQSAYWALVAIALSTATQPSGRILEFPSSWGPALKCSPIFCIVNTIEAISCIRICRHPEWTVVVAPHKYDIDADSAHTDIAMLQHNTLIRVATFVLGPILQATKLYACRGAFWTQLLAAIYLTSFICDEVTLCLLWLTGSTAGRDSVTGLVEAVLGSKAPRSSERPAAISDNVEGVEETNTPTFPQGVAICASWLFLAWFALDAVTGLYIKHKNLMDWVEFALIVVGGIALAIARGILSYKRRNSAIWILLDIVWGLEIPVVLVVVFNRNSKNLGTSIIVLENGVIDFHAKSTIKDWMWRIAPVPATLFYSIMAREYLAYVDCYGIPQPVRLTLTLWALVHLMTALAMFNFAYDPSRTFKPSWTDVLG